MFQDNPNTPPVLKRRAVTAKKKRWADEQKVELIKMYLMTGNLALSAASLKIPEVTARYWKGSQWWKEREHELRIQKDFKVSARLENIIERSLVTLEDRLEHGDFYYNRDTKSLERKPVSLLQAHKVATDMLERKDMIDKRTERGDTQEVAIDKFVQLAEKFAALAQKTHEKPAVEVTDVIYINENERDEESEEDEEGEEEDAVYDEWEEGLQEGEREIQLQTFGTEEEEFEDSSTSESQRFGFDQER